MRDSWGDQALVFEKMRLGGLLHSERGGELQAGCEAAKRMPASLYNQRCFKIRGPSILCRRGAEVCGSPSREARDYDRGAPQRSEDRRDEGFLIVGHHAEGDGIVAL